MFTYIGPNKIYTHDDIDKLRRLIENDYDTTNSTTHFSYKFERYLLSSGLGDILDLINCLLSFTIIMFYIISTYTYSIDQTTMADSDKINALIGTVEIFLCVFLILHFAIKLYVSQNRIYFLSNLDTIIDYGTIIPILLAKQTELFSDDMLHYLRLL
jgi:hypothetical protein